jgi:hypothetical protein
MLHTVLCCAVLLASGIPCGGDETSPSPETLVRLTVPPAPAPIPALRYALLPELGELNPGNPIQNYLKCFMEQQKFFFDKQAFERREKLLSMPLKELPARELQDYGQFALTQADWAARLDNPDWQILLRLKTDGVGLLLPDLQALRTLGTVLKVRFRAEVALGRFDDAIRTAKTMFAMSRHLSAHPMFIADLVGIAVANLALGPLEEMLEQPGCPNLYWALTNLPSPLVPIDLGWAGEKVVIVSELRELRDNAPMSADELKRFIARVDYLWGDGQPIKPGEGTQAWLNARTKDQGTVDTARRRLVEAGLPEDRLRQFPADQVMLLDQKRELLVRMDEIMKTRMLPIWQIEALHAQIKRTQQPALFSDLLLSGKYTVHRRQARLDQRIALLRHVEALRLYAAEHDGTLPAKLSEVTVPLPDDPFTGKPFRYEVAGYTAHLRGTPPPDLANDPAFNLHYEVILQK